MLCFFFLVLSQFHIILNIAFVFLFQCFRALCCKGPPPPRPEYDVVCIGLTGAGKTSLLSRLCNEGSDGIVPTTGKWSNIFVSELEAETCLLPSNFHSNKEFSLV